MREIVTLYSFEWAILIIDIIFVVIPPILTRHKSGKERKA